MLLNKFNIGDKVKVKDDSLGDCTAKFALLINNTPGVVVGVYISQDSTKIILCTVMHVVHGYTFTNQIDQEALELVQE